MTSTSTSRGRRGVRLGLALASVVTFGLAAAACGDDDDDDAGSEASVTSSAPAGSASSTSGSSPGAGSGEPYRIAAFADQTGPASGLGGPYLAGVRAAVEEINAAGGVNGHPIELDVGDDTQTNPDQGQAVVREVVSGEPLAILMTVRGDVATAMLPLLDAAQTVVIQGNGADAFLNPEPKEWYFQLFPTSQQLVAESVAQAEELLGGLSGRRVAIAAVQTANVDAIIQQFEARAESDGFEIVSVERNANGVPSFSTQAVNIASADPDLVFAVQTGPDTVTVSKGLDEAGVTVPVVAQSTASADQVMEAIGSDALYAPRYAHQPDDGDPLMEAANAAGVADQAVNQFFSLGWAAAYAVAEALEQCGDDCTKESVLTAMQSLDGVEVPGDALYGPISFADGRHNGLTAVQYFRWDPAASRAVSAGAVVNPY